MRALALALVLGLAGCQGPLLVLREVDADGVTKLYECQPGAYWTLDRLRAECGPPDRTVEFNTGPGDKPMLCDIYPTRGVHTPAQFEELAVCYETIVVRRADGFGAPSTEGLSPVVQVRRILAMRGPRGF